MYFSVERPIIQMIDRSYLPAAAFKSKLLSRRDPVHYVTVNFTIVNPLNNSYLISFYFYQLLSNVYKRSFVELHFKICDLLEKDEILGDALRQGYLNVPRAERLLPTLKCPLPPGSYSLLNMRFRLSALVETFPFQEGRVMFNVSEPRGKLICCATVDFQLKALPKPKN
ncbi:uncharacterized protein LOC112049657 [Bicyclus anynana]|uniref:Uncharacterized protein LOC112049657 n=1 Tax=Bicyclus anynana TaxID=110368 RepID=A0A6J1N924_BICAN|nr:uncharacterized protein LOC112049657 [Bicyclus anynana]